MSHECIIGLWHNYESSDLMSYEGLLRRLADEKESYEFAMTMGYPYTEISKPWKWSLHDYLDKRKSVNMTRFNFCPICGKKVDWKAMRLGTTT